MHSLNQIVPFSDARSLVLSSSKVPVEKHESAQSEDSSVYSVDKFLALDKYNATTSVWRVAGVMLVTPISALICALVPAFVPLQDPLDPRGVRANPGYLVSAFMITFIVAAGTLVHWRAGAHLSAKVYSGRQLLGVGIVSAGLQYGFVTCLLFTWRFPVPMSWIVVGITTGTAMALGHLTVFRTCWQDKELVDGIKRYIPALSIQALQIILYPAFSVLFDKVSSVYQMLLTLAFPVIKFFMKRLLRKVTHELKDFSIEVAATGVEICASLYQSMILQNVPSQVALIIIMTIDVLQGLVVVRFFMDRPSLVAHNQIVREALKDLKASNATTPSAGNTAKAKEADEMQPDSSSGSPSPPPQASQEPEALETTASKPSPVVADALHLVSVAESILLIEYIEVAIPLVNAIFIAVACQFNSAQYNTRLRRLYFRPRSLVCAMQSILFYSLFQLLSFVAMHLVMRYRYGMSATHHLAFILERHWESIVGKMIGWLPIILHFTVIHFGVDFSFRFDFAAMLRDDNAS